MEATDRRYTYRLEHLSFTYPGQRTPALRDIDLTAGRGEFITLCGPSGCGKTTLLRQLKPALRPHGARSGSLYFEGAELDALGQREQAAKIGFVLQSPENQIVTDTVWHELAFGLESLGMKGPEIRLRVAEMAAFFGIEPWFHRDVAGLSGGQKQLLALASVMALSPSVLLLDEPTSRLDPVAASEFLSAVAKINRDLGVTVILSEHRLDEVFPLSDRAIVMDGGRILADGPPAAVGQALRRRGHGMFAAMPTAMRVWAAVPDDSPCPVTVRDGRNWLSRRPAHTFGPLPEEPARRCGGAALETDEVWFKYGKNLPDVIKGLSFSAPFGAITAILGGNGAGKTTALSLIAGLCAPYRGKLDVKGTVAVLPQNPQTLFVEKTLEADLREMLSRQTLSDGQKARELERVAGLCRLEGLMDRHPYDLSGGEQQRAALAKVLLLRPQIVLLDEPTKGLDAEFKQALAAILATLSQSGAAVVMVSHDVEFCAQYADRCALLFDGAIAAEGTPRDFFSGNSFYTSAANRMAREVLPRAVTADDIVAALGGRPPGLTAASGGADDDDGAAAGQTPEARQPKRPAAPESAESPPKRAWAAPPRPAGRRPSASAAAAVLVLLVPLTLYLGYAWLGDRKYYFISLLIILETLFSFGLAFEGRKPQARELVTIAVLCAIAVAGRAAFFMLPQFKPVAAIVIISGVAFGGQTGFLVGATAAFVSNMFFGQGPWTPWQMFAFGLIGLLAGALFHKGGAGRRPAPLALFGGLSALAVYGPVMNCAHVLIYQPSPSWAIFVASMAQGLPFDFVHALATVIFLLIAARPMLEKLDRLMTKYGPAEISGEI